MNDRTKRRALLTAVALSTGMTLAAEGIASADPSCRVVKMKMGNTKGPSYEDVCLIDGSRHGHVAIAPADRPDSREKKGSAG